MKFLGLEIKRIDNAITSADLPVMILGSETASGLTISASNALFESTVFRCVSIISQTIGMLPLHVHQDNQVAKEHPIYSLLKTKPNQFQSAYQFKSGMMVNILKYGMAYALIVRGVGGRIIGLYPIHPNRVKTELNDDWTLKFTVQRDKQGQKIYGAQDIFYLADLTEDGYTGVSRIARAREAIGLAKKAEQSTAELMKGGLKEGFLKHPRQLTDKQFARLKGAVAGYHVLEDGMEPVQAIRSARDNQQLEQRKFQIEEIARVFGVPRPLVMMDETAWGTGIQALGISFVQYCLQPFFTLWEEAINTQLLKDENYYAKFNEKALLRGTLSEQGQYFASALGSGGGKAWMTINEVREYMDMPPNEELNTLTEVNNEPKQPIA